MAGQWTRPLSPIHAVPNTYSHSNTWHWRPYARSPLPSHPSSSLSEFTWAAAPAANKSRNQGGVVTRGRVSERERALPSGDNPNFRSPLHLLVEASSAPARRRSVRKSYREAMIFTHFFRFWYTWLIKRIAGPVRRMELSPTIVNGFVAPGCAAMWGCCAGRTRFQSQQKAYHKITWTFKIRFILYYIRWLGFSHYSVRLCR